MKSLVMSLVLSLLLVAAVQAACVSQTNGELTAQLSWTNNDQIQTDTINILRSNSAGTEKLLLNIPYGTTYTDTVPVPTSTISYFYEVQAQGPGGVSVPSNEGCKTFQAVPQGPTGLTVK